MAHYVLQKLRILPSVFAYLPMREQSFVYGSTLLKIEEEKKENDRIKSKGRRK
jgi:hypothetical protein